MHGMPAVVIYFVLPDYPKSPRSNKWLTQREPKYLETRLSENAPLTHESAFSSKEIKASLSDPRTYSFMINQILVNLAGYGLQWYLPTITTSLGFAGLPRNQLLNIPPTAAAVISIIIAGQLLKRAWVTRPAFTQPINALMAVGFIMFFTVTSKGAIYAACVIGRSHLRSPQGLPMLTARRHDGIQRVLHSFLGLAQLHPQRRNRHSLHPRLSIQHRTNRRRRRPPALSRKVRA